jgi:hypothetical protein
MARFLRSIGRSSTYTRDFANYAARAFHMPLRQSSQPCRKGRPVNYVTDPLSQKIIKVIVTKAVRSPQSDSLPVITMNFHSASATRPFIGID